MASWWLTAILTIGLSMMYSMEVMAFCWQPSPPRVCAEFFAASAVFMGRVVSVRYIPQGLAGHDPGWLYRMNVLQMYRGQAQPIIEVYTENNSGRFPLHNGEAYLLFAYKTDTLLEIYGCGNSSSRAKASAALKQIKKILVEHQNRSSGGSIGGRIETSSGMAADLAGIRITAQNGSRVFRAVTRKDGSFDIRVPAGRYNLRTKSSRWDVSPNDFSFNRPDDITIENGGCADVVFQGTPATPTGR